MSLKILKDDNGVEQTVSEMNQEQYFKAMLEDYMVGEITYKKAFVYKGKRARKGHVFYRIKYIKKNRYIYNGAYQFKAEVEAKYLRLGKLHEYLIYHLSHELSKK